MALRMGKDLQEQLEIDATRWRRFYKRTFYKVVHLNSKTKKYTPPMSKRLLALILDDPKDRWNNSKTHQEEVTERRQQEADAKRWRALKAMDFERFARYAKGEYSRSNIEALIADMEGKPL